MDKIKKYTSLLLVALLITSVAFVGLGVAQDSQTIEEDNRYWIGQTLDYEDDTNGMENAELESDEEGFLTELTVTDNSTTIDTEGYSADDYNLTYNHYQDEDSTEVVSFELANQTLTVEPDEASVNNDGDSENTFEIDSNRNTFEVNVSSDQLSDEDLADIFEEDENNVEDGELTVDASNDINVDFDGIDADEYEFTFDVVDTDASDTATVTVTEPGDAVVSLNESVTTVAEGDYSTMTVEFEETEKAYITIGDDDDVGYEIDFTVEDTDENGAVDITFNTYLAGQSNDSSVDLQDIVNVHEDSDGDVDVHSETELDDRQLAAIEYDISVFVENADGDETDVGTLNVVDRTEVSVTSMVSPGGEDIDDYEDVEELATESNIVAENDSYILAVETTGVFGFLEDGDTLTSVDTDNNGLFVEILRDSPNTNDDVNVSTADVYTNSEDGVFYVVFEEVTESEFVIDADYDVEVGITEENPYIEDSDSEESSETQFTTEERDVDFVGYNDNDVLEFPDSDEFEVTAEGNVADGTEVSLIVRTSTSDNPNINRYDVVSENNEFVQHVDGSELSLGDEFTVQIQDETDRVDAVIVEAEDDGVDDGTDDTDDGVDDGTDDTDDGVDDGTDDTDDGVDDGTDDTDDTTDDDTPGFGALVALVALIGAALLAYRRNE